MRMVFWRGLWEKTSGEVYRLYDYESDESGNSGLGAMAWSEARGGF